MEICYVPSLFFFYLIILLIPFVFSTLHLSNPRHPHLSNASDHDALLGFMSAITPSPLSTTWKPNVSFCNWTGITCSRRRPRVVSLNVSGMDLQGTISPLLGNLSFLRVLDLSNNSFHGHIPYQLGTLFRLKMLRLSLNELQGSIPPTLGGCRSLRNLILSFNSLTGNIPSEICVLPKLLLIALGVNNLTGTIPACLGNMSSLHYISLSSNNLHGSVPSELGMLSQVIHIGMDNNHIQGSIPPTLSGCRSLRNLTLRFNNLTGNIPSEICVLPKLLFIRLGRNNLTGTIPACLGNMSSLQYIFLHYNNLHGSVPSELGMLTQLILLGMGENHITGQIPSSLSNCTNLRILGLPLNQVKGNIPAELCSKNTQLTGLYLGGNQLSGSIPSSLFNCTKFQLIDLSGNQLSGVAPTEFGKLKHLYWLSLGGNQLTSDSSTTLPVFSALTNCSIIQLIDLSDNHFTGCLPFSIGRLSKLYTLTLRGNELVGEIPPHIGNLTSLNMLDLDDNSFIGSIPTSLNMLQNLERLYLGSNNLQGNIPTEIGQLKSLGYLGLEKNNLSGVIPHFVSHLQQLRYLYLEFNQLSGNIPASLGKCVNLLLLDLSHNKFSGHIPLEVAGLANLAFYFNLSNNLLQGPVPSALTKMTMLQAIDISANGLIGYISSALGSCVEVEYLNLSYNALDGPIPVSLGELQNLQGMDFSSNNLSGGIPKSLENLKMLRHLNLSFNKLSGEVPRGGVFKDLGATAFMGNLGLCGPWVGLLPCSTHKHKSVLHLKRVIIPIVAVIAIVVLCFFMGILWRQNHKRHTLREVEASLNVGHRRISYAELITATDDFSDANLLGVGSFGKVFKGVLNDGTMIAVKLLNLENEGAHKSFNRECKVLGRVRHRNLIRIITSYSDLQIKALIFPLMPSGSLEKWLYPDGEEESGLSLIQRLNIAIDIAQAMTYLHHHCFMQVIHCDLKPNNVLMGEDMTAYLIDFGIATICFANDEDSSFISTHALKGSAGYIPPEYGMGRQVTTKGDVYSYGILLLEMLTRKKPTHDMFVEGMDLRKWVGSHFPNRVREVMDMGLLRMTGICIEEDKYLNCLNQLINVGLLCTNESPEGRPTMMDILRTLQSIKDAYLSLVPKFQLDITHLLGTTRSTLNNTNEGQSSSSSTTF